MKQLCILVISLVLVGCATSEIGRPINDVAVSEIEKGATTKDSILIMFGQPYMNMTDSEGKETWSYMHGTGNYSVFSPASASGQSSTLTVIFDENGIVESYIVVGSRTPKVKLTTP